MAVICAPVLFAIYLAGPPIPEPTSNIFELLFIPSILIAKSIASVPW